MPGGIENDPAVRAALEPGERILWHGQPGAGRLFLSVVPALIRDVVFLIVLGFGIYASWNGTPATTLLLPGAIILLYIWVLVRDLRAGTAARVSHYLVTDRRILLLTSRARPSLFVVLPWIPDTEEERHRLRWLDSKPLIGRIAGGRATIRIGYQLYRSRTTNNYPDMVYRREIVRLYGVTDPDGAITAIKQMRRATNRVPPDADDLDDD